MVNVKGLVLLEFMTAVEKSAEKETRQLCSGGMAVKRSGREIKEQRDSGLAGRCPGQCHWTWCAHFTRPCTE